MPQSDLTEHMKLNNAVKGKTEGILCCFYQEIYRFCDTLFFQLFYQCWIIKRFTCNLSKTPLILLCTGIFLTIFSINGNTPDEKDYLCLLGE